MGWTKHGVERIGKLTAKQEDQIAVFAAKWDRIARSTEPWDRRAAVAGIKQFYEAMGVRQPKRFCGYDSVVQAWNAASYKIDDWETFSAKYPGFFNLQRAEWGMRCLLSHDFEPAILRTVKDFMQRNIAQSLGAGRIAGIAEAKDDVPQRRRIAYGQANARWFAMADYFATVHRNRQCERLRGLLRAVSSCGFVWLTPDKVVYCNRPMVSRFDEQGRLHCEDNVAIQFRDGWGFFFWHGVPAPAKFIKARAEDLRLDEILALRNSEARRAILEKFGFSRLLKTVKPRVISRSQENALIQFRLKVGDSNRHEYLRMLHLRWKDKTGEKETLLPVPRLPRQFGEDRPDNINDCEQVRRWTLGWPKEALAVAET